MKKLLISGVGGSLFPYLFKKLNVNYELFFLDSDEMVLKLYPNEKIFIVPLVKDESFEDEVIKIINENKIDFYIPLIDEEIIKAIDIGQKVGINILAPSKGFVTLTLDKYKLMHALSKYKISTIETFMANNFANEIKYPVFLKPNVGRGSRGIRKINNHNQFEAYFILEEYQKEEVLVQPFIDGQEYTVSVTVNNLNKIIAIIPKLVFVKQGITKHARSVKHKEIETVCKKIVDLLKPCGSFNVQLKIMDDVIYIFEINPRYSTTLVLSIESGINEITLNIASYNVHDVKYIEDFKEISLIRRWENYFYD